MQTLCAIIFTRCVRRFHAGDGAVISLAKDFAFLEAPTIGAKLNFAGEDLPALEVVDVTMLSSESGTVTGIVQVELAFEALSALDLARERGWTPIE